MKNVIIGKLQPWWDDKNVILEHKNIKVFLVCGDSTKEVGKDLKPLPLAETGKLEAMAQNEDSVYQQHKDEEKKKDDTSSSPKFVAVEYFTRVPLDLFRTVMLNQLEPFTYAHPDHAHSPWAIVSPLYCAAMNRREDKVQWCSATSNGDFKVHGVSTRCLDETEKPVAALIDPFGDIGENEEKGVWTMAIDQCKESAVNYKSENENTFGILKSTVTHDQDASTHGEAVLWMTKECRIEEQDKKKKAARSKKLATKRNPYFRFKIKKNLDLSDYGVAIVFDNSSSCQFTLVRAHGGTLCEWEKHFHFKVFLPIDRFEEVHKRDKGVSADFLKAVLQPDKGNEPVSFGGGSFPLSAKGCIFVRASRHETGGKR